MKVSCHLPYIYVDIVQEGKRITGRKYFGLKGRDLMKLERDECANLLVERGLKYNLLQKM